MEELAAAFGGNLLVSNEPNTTASPHPRFSQYKMKSEIPNQEKRRMDMLLLQKKKRFDVMKHVRRLTENIWDDELEDDDNNEEEAMEIASCWKGPGRHYKNQLMYSEWMLEIPENFETDWLMVPCPVGKRSLVIASKGFTKVFAKNGRQLNAFKSPLPGGSRNASQWRSETTILDCIYNEFSQTFYVLDMMCWRKTPIYDSEAEFRFFWLKTKLAEAMETDSADLNKYRFEPLSWIPCDSTSIRETMSKPFSFDLDGILFYHKHAHYTFGSTPLVVWLKPYMLPEILNIPVASHFFTAVPSTYENFKHHTETVRQQQQADKEKQMNKARERQNQKDLPLNGFDMNRSKENDTELIAENVDRMI